RRTPGVLFAAPGRAGSTRANHRHSGHASEQQLMRTILLVTAFLSVGCASHPPPPAASPPAPLPPLPRSSIAAVLEHRDEVLLSDDQVRQLERIDQEREKANQALLGAMAKHAGQGSGQRASSAPASAPPGGGGMGMGMGGMRAGRMGGGGRRPRAQVSGQ